MGTTLIIKLKEYLDASGHFVDVDEIPNDNAYTDTLTGKQRFTLTEEVPEIYLYKKEGKWFY